MTLACAGPAPPEHGPVTVTEPAPDEVESVLFLFGDAGLARFRTHPLLPRVRVDVDLWSQRLARDSAVNVLLLGDLIYPDGLDPRHDDEFSKDSAFIADQAALVADSIARARGSRAIFVAGNHDWGDQSDWEGTARLIRLQDFLDEQRDHAGVNAYLEPEAGTGGPGVLDVGEHLRIIMLDTAWWIFGAARSEKDAVLDSLRDALAGAGNRRVVLAAHHPIRSGGPHGIYRERSVGGVLRALLSRSGAWLQDIHSAPYRDLLLGLDRVFGETRPPDVFAAGHEHSAQVLRAMIDKEPPTQLILGSASKLSPVGGAPGMALGVSQPAYARLFVLRDGSLRLFIVAADEEHLDCADDDELADCMAGGVTAYGVLWGAELPRPERRPDGTLRY
jgi:hypothetical protein